MFNTSNPSFFGAIFGVAFIFALAAAGHIFVFLCVVGMIWAGMLFVKHMIASWFSQPRKDPSHPTFNEKEHTRPWQNRPPSGFQRESRPSSGPAHKNVKPNMSHKLSRKLNRHR
jgi:hypothetical protein